MLPVPPDLKSIFPNISDAKIKEGIFVGVYSWALRFVGLWFMRTLRQQWMSLSWLPGMHSKIYAMDFWESTKNPSESVL